MSVLNAVKEMKNNQITHGAINFPKCQIPPQLQGLISLLFLLYATNHCIGNTLSKFQTWCENTILFKEQNITFASLRDRSTVTTDKKIENGLSLEVCNKYNSYSALYTTYIPTTILLRGSVILAINLAHELSMVRNSIQKKEPLSYEPDFVKMVLIFTALYMSRGPGTIKSWAWQLLSWELCQFSMGMSSCFYAMTLGNELTGCWQCAQFPTHTPFLHWC